MSSSRNGVLVRREPATTTISKKTYPAIPFHDSISLPPSPVYSQMAGRPPALIALDRLAALGRQQTDALRRAPVDRTRPSAAVLVPLFVGREEHNQRLHVLLSRYILLFVV